MSHWLQRIILLALCLFVFSAAAPAMETNSKKDAPPSNEIEMPFIVCPATQDGKLVGYYYISYRMVTPSAEEASEIKSKLATLQDAYVRAVYQHDVYKPDQPETFDKDAFQTIILSTTKKLVHADKVSGITIRAFKYAPLHPKAAAQEPVPEVVKPDTQEETKDSAHKKPAGH